MRFSWMGLEREPCICVHDLCFLSTLATASGLAAANSYCYCWGILLPLSPFGSRKIFFALRIPPIFTTPAWRMAWPRKLFLLIPFWDILDMSTY